MLANHIQQTLAFGLPGTFEWIVVGVVALLIFGRRLPDVARNLGKSIVEFKKGIRDVKTDIDDNARAETAAPPKLEEKPNNQHSA